MARQHPLSAIANPLISSKQLLTHQRKHDTSILDSSIFQISLITQSAGILLRLPQEVIATSIIVLQRYLTTNPDINWPTAEDQHQQPTISPPSDLITASSASIFLCAKQSFYPLSPRSIINVYALLTSSQSPLLTSTSTTTSDNPPDPKEFYVSEGTYQTRLSTLISTERHLLTSLSFNTQVVLPYTLALTYLHALSAKTPTLTERVISHLNAALLSPQMLYLTHQPSALAVASVYFAARELQVPLVDGEVPWWEVFDVSREELGFLVLALGSLERFVNAQRAGRGEEGE